MFEPARQWKTAPRPIVWPQLTKRAQARRPSDRAKARAWCASFLVMLAFGCAEVDPLDEATDAPSATRAEEAQTTADSVCIHLPPRITATALSDQPVPPFVDARYAVTITNANVGCPPETYDLQVDTGEIERESLFSWQRRIFYEVESATVRALRPGESQQATLLVSGASTLEPGIYGLSVIAMGSSDGTRGVSGVVPFALRAAKGCSVSPSRELLIRSRSVVSDPLLAGTDRASSSRMSIFNLGVLLERTAGYEPRETLLDHYASPKTVNGFVTYPRTAQADVSSERLAPEIGARAALEAWRALDYLDSSQIALLAIVNRIDQRDLAAGHAGMLKFVYAIANTMKVSIEYAMPAKTTADVEAWATAWHQLTTLPLPSAAFTSAVAAIVTRVVGIDEMWAIGTAPRYVRIIDHVAGHPPEFRQFELSPATDRLHQVPVAQTPDGSLNHTEQLTAFINENEAAILREDYQVPKMFRGRPFLGSHILSDLAWEAPGVSNPEALRIFSRNTCNGCHLSEPVLGDSTHLSFRPLDLREAPSLPSIFLVGNGSGAGDLERRRMDLAGILCPEEGPPRGAAREAFLAKGIRRVH